MDARKTYKRIKYDLLKKGKNKQRKTRNIPIFFVLGDVSKNSSSDGVLGKLMLMLEASMSHFEGLGMT